MNTLDITARFKVKSGQMAHFKKIAGQMIEAVREKEKGRGCLQYDWFYNEAQSECTVREIYADSGAVLAHMDNVGPLLGQLADISEFSGQVCGTPSEELRKATVGMDITFFAFEARA